MTTYYNFRQQDDPDTDRCTTDSASLCKAAALGYVTITGSYDKDENGVISNRVAGGTGNGVPTEL